MSQDGSETVTLALAGLEPATADDATATRLLLHGGLRFEAEWEDARTATALLALDGPMAVAALVTRDQQAGTVTVHLHRAAPHEARAWLQAQTGHGTRAPSDRRAAAMAHSVRSTSPPARLRTAPVTPAPAAALPPALPTTDPRPSR